MRVSSVLRVARGNPREPVPFKEILPLKLKLGVSGKGDRTSEAACVHEMSVLFACLKANEFDQSFCSKEISAFQKCHLNFLNGKRDRKEKEAKGLLVPGERQLSAKQLNRLLRQYPNV